MSCVRLRSPVVNNWEELKLQEKENYEGIKIKIIDSKINMIENSIISTKHVKVKI